GGELVIGYHRRTDALDTQFGDVPSVSRPPKAFGVPENNHVWQATGTVYVRTPLDSDRMCTYDLAAAPEGRTAQSRRADLRPQPPSKPSDPAMRTLPLWTSTAGTGAKQRCTAPRC